MKQPRNPSSLLTGGSTHQNKAYSENKKLGQAPTPRPLSRKENRTGDEQRMSLQHAAKKSTKICSVCDTPIQEQHLHDHSHISSEVHSMSATYYENHHLMNKCSICNASTKEQQQKQEDMHWWRESTTSGVKYTNVQEKSWSWNHGCHEEKDVERSCQEMCEHFQMQTEKDSHQGMPSGSSGNIFQREFVEYQASLLAHYAKSCANKRSYREICRSCNHSMSNHEGQHNNTQEDGNGRSHQQQHPRGFRITKPMSGCQSDQTMALENFPAELIQGYRMGKRIWPLHTKREVCVGCSRPGSKRFQETYPHHVDKEAYRMLTISRFKPKLLEEKKLRFCTGLHRGKGEIMPAPQKRRVLPVLSLSCDKQKGVWTRKENQKERGSGHRGCCSQHWVSLLETSKRVCHTEGCHGDGGCNRSTDSTMTPDVVATLKITKKFQARNLSHELLRQTDIRKEMMYFSKSSISLTTRLMPGIGDWYDVLGVIMQFCDSGCSWREISSHSCHDKGRLCYHFARVQRIVGWENKTTECSRHVGAHGFRNINTEIDQFVWGSSEIHRCHPCS